MIVKEEFLSKLRRYFGLNLYEVKVWTALLSRGVSTAGELSDIANVPRSRSYDVLESLEKKGFIVMKLGKPIKYIAVPPEEVIERVKKNVLEEAKTSAKLLEELKASEVLSELNVLHKQGVDIVKPTEVSGYIRSRRNIHNHISALIKTAKENLVFATTEEAFLEKYKEIKPLIEKAKSRGVNVRVALNLSTSKAKGYAKELAKVVDVRQNKHSARFTLADNKQLLFMVLNHEDVNPGFDMGIWVQAPYFADYFSKMFDSEWQRMKPID